MRNIDKNVVMLGWVSFFTDMASAMINPILPVFIVVILHEGMDKLGIIVTVASILISLNTNRAFISQHADHKGSFYGIFYASVALLGAIAAYIIGLIWKYFGMQSALLFSFDPAFLLEE